MRITTSFSGGSGKVIYVIEPKAFIYAVAKLLDLFPDKPSYSFWAKAGELNGIPASSTGTISTLRNLMVLLHLEASSRPWH